jgi:hypothetical protein
VVLFKSQLRDNPAAQDKIVTWIKALRSGLYSQSHGVLRDKDGGFCCLGVVLDLEDPNGWDIDLSGSAMDMLGKKGFQHKLSANSVTGTLVGGANIYYPNNEAKGTLCLTNEGAERLGVLNDGSKMDDALPKSFAQIADFLETQMKLAIADPGRLDPVAWSPSGVVV